MVKQNIVESISVRHIERFLKGVPIETTSVTILANQSAEKDPEQFDAQVETICELYAEAAQLSENESKHIMSTDEKTGIQALERKAPTADVARLVEDASLSTFVTVHDV